MSGREEPSASEAPQPARGPWREAVRMYVDPWDPAYGSGVDADSAGPTAPSSAQLDLDVERPADSWEPLTPAATIRAPDQVLFVDGVRRIDATVWVEAPDGTVQPGLAASYAAGVVRCDARAGTAEVVAARVERGIFTPSPDAVDLGDGITRYAVRHVSVTDPGQLAASVQPYLSMLEAEVSASTRSPGDLLVIDGPLRGRSDLPRAVGYVKTHARQYLPAGPSAIVARLRPGQRTPVFRLGTSWHRYSWYLKLPGPAGGPWAGVVRLEAAAELPVPAAVELADRSAVTLPRFSSSPYKDPRAPQNLIPIAGLESRLRRMLGDPRLLLRRLTTAAMA